MEEAVGNREAVERVVREHAGWVFAAAKRRVKDATLAEDVTQAVFVLYWRKGVGIAHEGKRVGWLYRAVRYCSANALRLRNMRERHEREAAMDQQREERSAGWSEVEAELEGAMDRLSEQDRQAVVLRFYRGLSLREVGEAMGIGEEAARKRVDRAVGKLRGKLVARGVEVEAGALGAMVLAHAGVGGPAGLVEKVMRGMGSNVAGGIAKGAGKMMAMAKVKVGLAVAALVLAGSGVVMHVAAAPPSVAEVPAAPAAPAVAPSVQVEVLVRGSAQERHLYELLYLLRHPERGPKRDLFDRGESRDEWCDAIRQVIQMGKPAVPYLVAELGQTKSEFCMRNVAFALRGIDDPRAVSALIRAMSRCPFGGSDMGVPLKDAQLAAFMAKHSVGETTPQVPNPGLGQAFYYHRAIVQIDAALTKLAGHSEGDAHLRANPFGKTDAEQQAIRDVYSATAARWQKWWDQNHAKLASDQELATVQLPLAQGDPIEAAGKARFGDLTGADLPLEPLGVERLQTRFIRISRAVNQEDARAVSDAVAGTLKDYKELAQQAAERQASEGPLPSGGATLVVAGQPETRVALLEDMQKAVQAGDWTRARDVDRKLNQFGPGIVTFTRATSPTTAPVSTPRQAASP